MNITQEELIELAKQFAIKINTKDDKELITSTDTDWRTSLETDSRGNLKQSNVNCRIILENDEILKEAFKYNELRGSIDVVKDLPWIRDTISISDNDIDNTIIYLEKYYGIKADRLIERAIRTVAHDNRYHPVKDKLNSLVWDKIPRLPNVLNHFLGVEKNDLTIEFLKVFMLGAIERVFNPGCKFEYMLCIVGGQGAGKSTFLRFLAINDEWFTDDIRQLNDKDVYEHLQGHWIIEIPEMVAILRTKTVEETKAFISKTKDNYRIPYEKYSADRKRQFVFAGTSNQMQFLPSDRSGNRRFLPIEADMDKAEVHILDDEEYSRAYMEQLWAEVMELYRSGNYSLAISKEIQDRLTELQCKYTPEDIIGSSIQNYIESYNPEYVCTKMLFEKALGYPRNISPDIRQARAIGDVMNNKYSKVYEKLDTHNFSEYGIQRAWKRINDLSFMPLSSDEESHIPFK